MKMKESIIPLSIALALAAGQSAAESLEDEIMREVFKPCYEHVTAEYMLKNSEGAFADMGLSNDDLYRFVVAAKGQDLDKAIATLKPLVVGKSAAQKKVIYELTRKSCINASLK